MYQENSQKTLQQDKISLLINQMKQIEKELNILQEHSSVCCNIYDVKFAF